MDQDEARRFGHLLKRRRGELGLSTHDLGKLVGTRNSTIMRIEQGAFAAPRPDKLARIANALHLSLADVFARAGYVVPNELPTFREYLAARYRELPEVATSELARHFDELMIQHGLSRTTFEVGEVPMDEINDNADAVVASGQPGGVLA